MATSPQTKPNGTKPATAKRAPQTATQHKQPPKTEPEQADKDRRPLDKDRKRHASFDPLELTPLQETAIDLCADLIIHGGNREDASNVMEAALSHYYRMRFNDPRFVNPNQFKAHLDGFLEKRLPDWETEIPAAWKRNPRAEIKDREEGAAKLSLTAKARAHSRQQLIGYLESFANEATGEEALLMLGVMENWDGSNAPSVWGYPDIALAEAFATEIGERAEYIRVPSRLIEQVRRFVEALLAIEHSPKAA